MQLYISLFSNLLGYFAVTTNNLSIKKKHLNFDDIYNISMSLFPSLQPAPFLHLRKINKKSAQESSWTEREKFRAISFGQQERYIDCSGRHNNIFATSTISPDALQLSVTTCGQRIQAALPSCCHHRQSLRIEQGGSSSTTVGNFSTTRIARRQSLPSKC